MNRNANGITGPSPETILGNTKVNSVQAVMDATSTAACGGQLGQQLDGSLPITPMRATHGQQTATTSLYDTTRRVMDWQAGIAKAECKGELLAFNNALTENIQPEIDVPKELVHFTLHICHWTHSIFIPRATEPTRSDILKAVSNDLDGRGPGFECLEEMADEFWLVKMTRNDGARVECHLDDNEVVKELWEIEFTGMGQMFVGVESAY